MPVFPAVRRHWLLAILLAAGLVLRGAALLAYRPALLYIDSVKYLYGAYPGDDPPGYQLALKFFLRAGSLPMVAAGQHLLGLAMAVALYLILLRRGSARWLAALASAPVLLDAYQLQSEQSIMPDTAFEALAVAGFVLLLWVPQPRLWLLAAAGVLLGASATVRQVGEVLIVAAVVYVLVAVPGWRGKLTRAVALCAVFTLPILAMSFRNYVALRHFSLAPYAASTIYGRAAAAADCGTLRVPAAERPLCPTRAEQARGPDWLDHGARSPIKHFTPPPGEYHYQAATAFSRQVFRQQPLRVAMAIGTDAVKLFSLRRVTIPGDTPIWRWQFQGHFPLYPPYVAVQAGRLQLGQYTTTGAVKVLSAWGRPATWRPVASWLRTYQLDGGCTPGPLLLFALLAGLAGSACVARPRQPAAQRATVTACLLLFTSGTALLLASDAFEFSWRYQLPALVTLPAAGVLGLTAITGYVAARRPPRPGQPAAAGTDQPGSPHWAPAG